MSDVTKLTEGLSYHLNQGDRPAFLHILGKQHQQMLGKPNMTQLQAVRIFQSIVTVFIDYVTRYSLQEKISEKLPLRGLYNLETHDSWTEAFQYLARLADILFTLGGDEEQHRNEKLVREMKQYIRNHLSADLSLTFLSNHFNYSNSYLSRVFNQTANISLTAYINNLRIDRAKELLRQTNATIQEVSMTVGFDSSQYFSIVFKKLVGTSPREFRSQFFSD